MARLMLDFFCISKAQRSALKNADQSQTRLFDSTDKSACESPFSTNGGAVISDTSLIQMLLIWSFGDHEWKISF